jgi:alkylhydroperoxidase family enzyme
MRRGEAVRIVSDSPNPRIRPVADPTPELREIYKNVLSTPTGDPLNVFATLAHNPRVLKRFSLFAGMFLAKNSIPVREREIVILRVARNCRSIYEFGQHRVIGRECGLVDAEIADLARAQPVLQWSARDSILVAMSDELCRDNDIGDSTWAALRNQWSESELVELIMLVGSYRALAGFLNATRVERDDGVPGWPDDADV